MLSELAHESTAKLSDLIVGFPLRIEISTTLAAAHVQAGQRILEDLLEAQELQDGQVHGWVESKTTLVWTKGRVELDSVATVDLDFALVVLPDNSELDYSLRYGGDLEGFLVFWVLLKQRGVLKGGN